jgi:hypothetical protein
MTRKTYCGNLLWQSGLVGSRRLAKDVGLDKDESEPILDCVIEACRNLVPHGVS